MVSSLPRMVLPAAYWTRCKGIPAGRGWCDRPVTGPMPAGVSHPAERGYGPWL